EADVAERGNERLSCDDERSGIVEGRPFACRSGPFPVCLIVFGDDSALVDVATSLKRRATGQGHLGVDYHHPPRCLAQVAHHAKGTISIEVIQQTETEYDVEASVFLHGEVSSVVLN